MFNDKKIDVWNVEVLDNNVQRYSSTTVSGGGGHVSTVNGTTIGRTQSINSTVNHHVSQDIWVKDLSSGKEMQLSLKEAEIPVRPSHKLWIAYDHGSERWERIMNESTDEFTYGNGLTNPVYVAKLRGQAQQARLSPLLLIIPFLNLLGGLVALFILLTHAPVSVSGKTIPGNGEKVLIALIMGVGLFFSSFWALAMIADGERHGFFMKVISLAAVVALTPMFAKAFKAPFVTAAEMIEGRSKTIDAAVQQAKTKSSATPMS